MPTFASYDGTVLSYRLVGQGPLLLCVPGGPARDSVYLGTLGGLDAHRTLVLLDNRGTGQSADASDPDSYRADKLVHDVEALRARLGLETVDLLGHSAGAHIAVLYAAAHPARLASLALITGGQRVAGLSIEGAATEAVLLRANEPWYPAARAALDERLTIGHGAPDSLKRQTAPFFYGVWDDAAAAHADTEAGQRRNPVAYDNFPYVPPDPAAVRERLGAVTAPVLVLAGELDPSPRPEEATALAELFGHGRVMVQPGAGHFPWLDDPEFFIQAILEA